MRCHLTRSLHISKGQPVNSQNKRALLPTYRRNVSSLQSLQDYWRRKQSLQQHDHHDPDDGGISGRFNWTSGFSSSSIHGYYDDGPCSLDGPPVVSRLSGGYCGPAGGPPGKHHRRPHTMDPYLRSLSPANNFLPQSPGTVGELDRNEELIYESIYDSRWKLMNQVGIKLFATNTNC